VLFYWNDKAVAAQTDGSFSGDKDNRETTNKDSGNFKESVPTTSSGSASITAFFDDNATLTPEDLFEAWTNGDVETAKLSTEEDGDYAISGDAYISSYSENYPDHDNIEISLEVTFTGTISKEKITTTG
jgi:hypothetical protein